MAQGLRHLHLLIPELSGQLGSTAVSPDITSKQPDVGALEILLARSERVACATNTDALLFEIFGIALKVDKNHPVAPLTYGFDTGLAAEGWWLRADPVYLRPDSDRVFLMGNDCLNIHQHEADALREELASLFEHYGAQFYAPTPKRWYLHMPQDPGLFWYALQEVRGWDIHRYLVDNKQDNSAAKLWRHILNEVQMVLHSSTLNDTREARGELPINSLWFWGGGTLPATSKPPLTQAWGNQILALSLAKHTNTPHTAAPVTGTLWLEQAITAGEHLVVLENLANPNSPDENLGIEAFNKDWFAPLLAALKSHELASLHLYAGNGMLFRATAKSVARWWKRPRSIALYQGTQASEDRPA